MKLTNILGWTAVAGAAYFLNSQAGRNMLNQYKPQFDGWLSKGEEAFRGVTEKFRSSSMS